MKMFNIFKKQPAKRTPPQIEQQIEVPHAEIHHPHPNNSHAPMLQQQPQQSIANATITKSTTIGDIVQHYPEAVEPLMAAGVHCVGCHVSPYETLEQGLKGHGMSDDAVIAIITKLNQAIQKKSTAGESLSITDAAAAKIRQLAKEKKALGLRVQVTPGGCSGYQYEFIMENSPGKEDKVIQAQGVKLFVNPKTLSLIAGSEVDYLDALQGAGFKIQNPKAKSTCGCGSSFS